MHATVPVNVLFEASEILQTPSNIDCCYQSATFALQLLQPLQLVHVSQGGKCGSSGCSRLVPCIGLARLCSTDWCLN